MIILVLANLGNTMAEFAGIAASAELFNINRNVLVILSAVFVWWLVVKGTYKIVEKVFLTACLFYVSYIVTGFLVKIDFGEVALNVIKPEIHFDKYYLFMLIGLIGTTIAPWMQFYQQSSIVEKGIKLENYKYNKLDIIIGSFIVNIVAVFIVVVCAATLFKNGVQIESARDAALALKPLAGKWCFYLFGFGLFNASLFAASILPLCTAYSVCEGMGWELGVDKRFKEAPQFYILYTGIIVLGVLFVLIPDAPLIKIMLITQVVNGLLLPFVLIFMLILVNNKRLMGDYVNSKAYNVFSWFVVIGMMALSVAFVFTSFLTNGGN